ncbi:MAG TPA: 3-phosphoshikimate 1-carboxyvinyltransferase [Egibacteraceae bacterium]|nr:3-phosphoshikimate 1-carboxyvinyltransferase [Egibacteraceae bacterium]
MSGFLDVPAVEVRAAGPLHGTLRAPSSKSLTNRALLVAALAEGTSRLDSPLDSDDAQAMRVAISTLGATVEEAEGMLTVHGTGGDLVADGPVDARLSGTTMRFVAAAAALSRRRVVVTGAAPLLRRPVGPLTRALQQLGATAADHDGFPPVAVGGGLSGGEITIDVSASSQYASALLLVAPYAARDVTVHARGDAADAYIDLTVDLMRRWGADVEQPAARTWTVRAGRHYVARNERVEYDASAAAHLFTLAAATGGSVTVTNTAPRTLQPDARMVDALAAMGCTVVEEEAAVSVAGPDRLRAVDIDLTAMPDQVANIAVLAAVADGTTTITGAAVTRGHETDRLHALATELTKAGVHVDERDDGLVVTGGGATGDVRLDTYDDHRLAMAFAALAAAVDGITIAEPGCVAKTYPGFWDDLVRLGGVVRTVA